MKKVLLMCLKAVSFLGIFCLIFLVFQECLRGKWIVDGKDNTASTSTFREYRSLEENTVDVLFVGTSHVLYGIDPMYLYEQTGITSYVFSGPGLRMDLTYLTLKEALKTQSPKVVLLDASGMHYKGQQSEGKARKIADQLPLSWDKLEYAFHNGNEELDAFSVMFPLFRYHSRWSKLGGVDLRYMTGTLEDTYLRGHHVAYERVPAELGFEKEPEFQLTERNLDYYERIINLCRENGIELITYKIPTPLWYKSHSSAMEKAAAERGEEFWELYYELDEIGIDVTMDFHDESDHLNQYGAEKLTTYLGNYLIENYHPDDHRGKNERWDKDLKEYYKFLEKVKKEYEES